MTRSPSALVEYSHKHRSTAASKTLPVDISHKLENLDTPSTVGVRRAHTPKCGTLHPFCSSGQAGKS